MNELVEKAKELLKAGTVKLIIGYKRGSSPLSTMPVIVRTEKEAEQLVYNESCANNLAVYLTRKEFKHAGTIGIVAKGCDVKAIVQLIQENQVVKDNLYIIGMNCNGTVAEMGKEFGADNIALKCFQCSVRTPHLYHTLIGEPGKLPEKQPAAGLFEKFEAMNSDERWNFWEAQFEKCLKCYACRQVCPMCYCERCIADKTVPRWIESSAHTRGNASWNIIRAFHLGGRCIGCNECERVCPADIPLSLLNKKLGMVAKKEFDYIAGMSLEAPTLVGTYNNADREDFIK